MLVEQNKLEDCGLVHLAVLCPEHARILGVQIGAGVLASAPPKQGQCVVD